MVTFVIFTSGGSMEYVLFAALSGVAAVLFNYAFPMVTSNAKVSPYLTSYAGKTIVTAATFFVVLIVAGSLMALVGERTSLPTPV
jgi:hypothetical protein